MNKLQEEHHYQTQLVGALKREKAIMSDTVASAKIDYLNAARLFNKIALQATYRALSDAQSELYRRYVRENWKLEDLELELEDFGV